MRTLALVCVVLAALAGGVPSDASAQSRPRRVLNSRDGAPPQDSQVPDDGGDADIVSIEGALVEVPVVVADRSGRYVPRLRQEDFRLLEDGTPQQISFFSDQRVPIHVAIVMDTSGSTQGTIGEIQEAAIEFIQQLLPGDQVMIVSFSSDVVVEQEFTNDRNRLSWAIRRTRANGSTKLYEAVYLTVAERLARVEGRKAMVILSDGEDTASKEVTYDEAANVCSETDVVAYGIRYPESSGSGGITIGNSPQQRGPFPQPRRGGGGGNGRRRQQWPGIPWPSWPFASYAAPGGQLGGHMPGKRWGLGKDRFMEEVTGNSGGALFYADAVSDVRGVFAKIVEDLRHVYVIGYGPSNPVSNGGYRRITVQVPSRPDMAVRHRLGYQADTYNNP